MMQRGAPRNRTGAGLYHLPVAAFATALAVLKIPQFMIPQFMRS
jgi:hypothetical protein